MVVASADAAADRRADDHGRGVFAAGAVAQLGQLTHDLIVSWIDEIRELDFRYGAQAVERHADGRADDPGLGQRRVDTALGPELFLQAAGRAKDAAEPADILAQ